MNALAQLQKTQSLHYNGIVKLNDATSVMMQDSFLIKNHNNANFDSYYQMMKKRKTGFAFEQQQTREADSPPPLKHTQTRLNETVARTDYSGVLKGRMPTARDGHSAVVIKNLIIIFGGDRHRMPFSDTFIFNVQKEIM